MLPYGRQIIEQDDIDAVVNVLKSDYLTTGPTVKKFEKKLCDVTGAKYAVACSNGTTALHLACLSIGMGEGDCAIVPTITFLATANAVRYCGANVIFCDVNPKTGLMTPETFQNALHDAVNKGLVIKAVLPVHIGGQPTDLEKITSIAKEYGITVIADSCHAIGGSYKTQPIGSCQFEDMATFSFHPVKTIAMGEGGAITTNNEQLANDMRTKLHHGMVKTEKMLPWEYQMTDLGYNYRVTDIQCALGISQLNKIGRFTSKREELVALYNEKLDKLSEHIACPKRVQTETIGWHLYAVAIDFDAIDIDRATFMDKLQGQGVGTQVHYIPVHTQQYYKDLYGEQKLPGAEEYYNKTLSLPLYPSMTTDDVEHVFGALSSIIKGV